MSQVVALAPFSQNSNTRGSAGLAHAQLTHMKPWSLFCFKRTRLPLPGTCSCVRLLAKDFTDPQPPAGKSSGFTRRSALNLRLDDTGALLLHCVRGVEELALLTG